MSDEEFYTRRKSIRAFCKCKKDNTSEELSQSKIKSQTLI